MDDNKINKNKVDLKTNLNDGEKLDVALFDKTLRQIEKTLENIDVRIAPKDDSQISEKIHEETINNKIEEHTIDNTHLRMEELHSFSVEPEIKNKSSFGFYTYLALVVAIVFALYEILNISKDYIILKYPASQPYIEYFYEIIEILAYLVMNIVSFIKNLF